MSFAFTLGDALHSDLFGLFQVFPAQSIPRTHSSFLVKNYTRASIADVDLLLKEALVLVERGVERGCRLIGVEVDQPDVKLLVYSVRLVFEKTGDEFDTKVIERDDSKSVHRSGLDGYVVHSYLYKNENAQMFISEASGVHFREPLIVKKFIRRYLSQLNTPLREAIFQARVAHPNVCTLMDIALEQVGRRFVLSLVLERLSMSVQQQLRLRISPFTEDEVRLCLIDVGFALVHGRELVGDIQGIAHGDIRPSNILRSESGHYKLTDFGEPWEGKLRSVITEQISTFCFLAPEVRTNTQIRPFPADIFALGMTLLYMASGGFSERTLGKMESTDLKALMPVVRKKIQSLRWSEAMKAGMLAMTSYNAELRPTIEMVMMHVQSGNVEPITTIIPVIVKFERQQMSYFSVDEQTWVGSVRLTKSLQLSRDMTYVLVRSNTIFLCELRCAYLIPLNSDFPEVEDMPTMCFTHDSPGLLYYQDTIFVFGCKLHAGSKSGLLTKSTTDSDRSLEGSGSADPQSKNCEKMELAGHCSWTPLVGGLKEWRCNFTPCVHKQLVYISGGWAATIETYNLASQRFEKGPAVLLPEYSATVSFMRGEKLVVLSTNYVTVIDLRRQRAKEAIQKKVEMAVSAKGVPIVTGVFAYWVGRDNKCYRATVGELAVEVQVLG